MSRMFLQKYNRKMLASYHPYGPDLTAGDITIGKTSRIQDGFVVRIHSVPRTKYEGLHVVVGPCTYHRKPNGYVELVGESVDSFWNKFKDIVLFPTAAQHTPNAEIQKELRVKSKDTRFFRYHSGQYSSIVVPDPCMFGFAVIMTRGPWFHCTKTKITCSWELREFIQITS
jgi:hypothetical protein